MNNDQIWSSIRILLMTLGGMALSHGLINSTQLEDVVGALMVILPAVYAIWSKRESAVVAKAVNTVNSNPNIVGDATQGTVVVKPATAS